MARTILILLAAMLLTSLFLLMPACGSNPSDPGGGDDPGDDPPGGPDAQWPENGVGIPEADEVVFQELQDRYLILRAGSDAATARANLLSEAESWEGLREAELLSDGSSIQFVFSDSVRAVFLSDEYNFGSPRPIYGSEGRIRLHSVKASDYAATIESVLNDRDDRTDCGNIKVPNSHKISLVNISSGIKDFTTSLVDELKEHLVSLGWDPDDIDIHDREGFDDYSWTLDDVFNQSGYGVVFILGQGGFTTTDQGEEYYILEGFRGGDREDGYEEHVSQERWDEYMEWFQEDGTLVEGKAYGNNYDEIREEIYIREDLLAEEMIIDEGAMVHVLSNHGFESAEEFQQAGASSVTGWGGGIDFDQGVDAFKLFMENMVSGDDGAPMDALNAAWNLGDLGTFDPDDGPPSLFTPTVESFRAMLPAQLRFDAPFDCLEEGTEYYEVNVSYPECPGLDTSFQFFPGGDFDITGLPPVGAEIEFTARDAEGQVVGGNAMSLQLTGGPNDIELCPCEGSFLAAIPGSDLPPGSTILMANIDYDNPDIPDETRWADLPASSFDDLVPGSADVDLTVWNGDEKYGETIMAVDVACDTSIEWACFGWFTFEVIEYPASATEIQVEVVHNTATPNPLIFDPSSPADMYGFTTGEEVLLFGSAFDASGRLVGVHNQEMFVNCGANQVLLEFDPYGIVFEAIPDSVAAREGQFSDLIATVRYFTDYDTTEPTGDPIAGKLIIFETDLGEFGDEGFQVFTDENGEAGTTLSSLDIGTATVHASCDAGAVEAAPVTVEFLELLTIFIDNRPTDHEGDWGHDCADWCWLEYHCLELEMWCEDELIRYDEGGPFRATASRRVHPVVGNTITFVFTPIPDCCHEVYEPPYDNPVLGSFWLHWYFGTNYGQQITVHVTSEVEPVLEPIAFEIILTDPITDPPPIPRQVSWDTSRQGELVSSVSQDEVRIKEWDSSQAMPAQALPDPGVLEEF
jgi:hypothetical protein